MTLLETVALFGFSCASLVQMYLDGDISKAELENLVGKKRADAAEAYRAQKNEKACA